MIRGGIFVYSNKYFIKCIDSVIILLHNSTDDYFYSKANTAHLDRSIAQPNSGKAKAHELIEEDSNE